MKTYRIARLEKLISEIEDIAKNYPFWENHEKLQEILILIAEYRYETPD